MPWDRPDVAGAFTLRESARRLGACRWVELRLYEAMGGWVPTVPELDVRLALGSAAHAHAWHASQWAADPAPWDAGVEALLDAVAGATGTLERVVGAYRVVVPRLVAAYTAHRNHTSEASDPPLARSLALVLADELAAWHQGEMLVQSLIVDGDGAGRAAAHQGRLEALIAAPRGLAGPRTLCPGDAAPAAGPP